LEQCDDFLPLDQRRCSHVQENDLKLQE
jgi:hypothetical protein